MHCYLKLVVRAHVCVTQSLNEFLTCRATVKMWAAYVMKSGRSVEGPPTSKAISLYLRLGDMGGGDAKLQYMYCHPAREQTTLGTLFRWHGTRPWQHHRKSSCWGHKDFQWGLCRMNGECSSLSLEHSTQQAETFSNTVADLKLHRSQRLRRARVLNDAEGIRATAYCYFAQHAMPQRYKHYCSSLGLPLHEWWGAALFLHGLEDLIPFLSH